MRATSGSKFSLGSAFGRRPDKHERAASYSGATEFGLPPAREPNHSRINGAAYNDTPDSPDARGSGGEGGGSGGGSGGVQFKKLGKTFAHNNLLPGLGNKDLKALQDVIAAEKGVLSSTEKLATETSKAASVLPNYGLQEGPDLQDILTQSSHLLNHLSSALNVYAERQVSLRGAYKKIRDREESFMELRSQRRSTGSKAEAAERKLAKMGPENKGLVSQTELLERLRQEMRSMDTEIVKEETGLGDYKRQIVKEAFMYKFSGLEELGEKLCIIGEMGKLVIDEIPLEETPVGYGRAPYGGFTKTESAVEEAQRCIGQVKFTTVETTLKPSHLPHAQHLNGRSELPRQESVSAAEEFGHFPVGMASPQTPGRIPNVTAVPPPGGSYGLDENPYGGIRNTYYGGDETDARRQTLWQGPTEDALRQQNRASDGIEYAQARIASMYGHSNGVSPSVNDKPLASIPTNQQIPEEGHDYEHEQQAEMDRQHELEQAAQRDQPDVVPAQDELPNPHTGVPVGGVYPAEGLGKVLTPPWQPLNVKRGATTPEPRQLHDNPVPPFINEPSVDNAPLTGHSESHSNTSDLIPPPSMAQLHARAPTPGTEGFRTPPETPNLEVNSFQHQTTTTDLSTLPHITPLSPIGDDTVIASPISPSVITSGVAGKMSAGAFRNKAAPRRSESGLGTEAEEGTSRGVRSLPVPPGGYTPSVAGPGGATAGPVGGWPDEKKGYEAATAEERGAPPSYGDESLR